MQKVLYCPKCRGALDKSSDKYFCRACHIRYPVVDGIPSFVEKEGKVNSFDPKIFEFLFKMEQKHFWQVGRRELILDVLKRNVPHLANSTMLEIGCGNGNVLAHLKSSGISIAGMDILMEGLRFCRQRSSSVDLYQADILSLPFLNNWDIIGVFDVLEHISEDEAALREVNRALKPAGYLILTVPAHKFLWSHHDRIANHVRRYDKSELATKLRHSGFSIKKISYYVSSLFPILAAIRMSNKLFDKRNINRTIDEAIEVKTIPVINETFLQLIRFETWLIRYFSLPVGASLIALAEKLNAK